MFAVTYTSEYQLIELSLLQFLVRPENGKDGERTFWLSHKESLSSGRLTAASGKTPLLLCVALNPCERENRSEIHLSLC